tara:strand:+ start:24890 stop:26899 length:2010 start_codon:yes stop_codon:yes gene_type:complete
LIQTPTAETKGEGSIYLTYNKQNIWKLGTLTVTPYDWLEASYFYYRPVDLYFGTLKGKFLDKGFNVKFLLKNENNYLPSIAIGLDDFAGTGLFSREYLVATQQFKNIKLTAGLGWGQYSSGKQFDNPIGSIKKSFLERPLPNSGDGQGGLPSYNTWFKGPANFLGGVELFVPYANGLKAKLEYDPFDYSIFSVYENSNLTFAPNETRFKDSDINVGLSYPVNNNLTLDLSYIKGNMINFSFSFGGKFDRDYKKKKKFKPKIDKVEKIDRRSFYINLLKNINNNDIYLQTANLDKKNENLEISVSSSIYRNPIQLTSRSAYIANLSSQYELKTITVSQINTGIELNKIKYKTTDLNKGALSRIVQNNTISESGSMSYRKHEFKPTIKFPALFSSFAPDLRSHIGSPEEFAYFGIGVKHTSEIQFSRNLIFISEIGLNISDNFDEKTSRPDSPYLPNVRTEIIQYLQASEEYITRMQLDYIWSPRKDIYSKISGGILEQMYAGFGGEILYKPYDKNYSIGMNIYSVKKRDYSQKFEMLDYKTITGHLEFNYFIQSLGILANISYGQYLANDKGFTFDLSRQNKYGFRAGVFFSNTDVSALEFGEGSFDKGFYFQIPFEFLTSNKRGDYFNFKLRPLTRDGAAKLEVGNDLPGLIFNSTKRDINNGWYDFLN